MSWNNIIPVEYYMQDDLVSRLRERARIRRQISTRKSVQEGKPDRIADLLEEAANALEAKEQGTQTMDTVVGATPTQGAIVLPGEAAQHLAHHLSNNQYLYTEEQQAAIHPDELAWVIQEYWDSLI